MTKIKTNWNEDKAKMKISIFFIIFCIWILVLLNRPQDIFPALATIRPALIMSILTISFFLFRFSEFRQPPFFKERQVKYYTAFIFIIAFSVPFSLYPRLSFMVVFTKYITVIFFFFIFYKVVNSVKKLSIVLMLNCIGNGFYATFSIIIGHIYSGRLSFGSMFDSNDLAYFTLAFLPLNLLFISRDNPVWIRLACLSSFAIGSYLIFLSGSRGGMIAFVVVIAMLLFINTKTVKLSFKIALICICIAFVYHVNINRYLTIFTIDNDYNVTSETGRLAIWSFGIKTILANPMTGVGVSCFEEAIGNDRAARGATSTRWQAAHNSIIQIGAETGIVGLILFISMSLNVLRIFSQVKQKATQEKLIKLAEMGLVGFTGLFICGIFLSQAYSMYWTLYIVLSAVVNQLLIKEKQQMTKIGSL